MDVGLALPQYDFSLPGGAALGWDAVAGWARRAEQAGLGSVWLADHLSMSLERYGGPPGERFCLDPVVGLGALARTTGRVRLGTLVLCAQLRPPRLLAKMLATVDVLSAGRLTVGVGAGWYRPDYEAAGVPFERPGARLRQLAATLAELAAMLGDDPPAPCRPGPDQRPRPPLWVGGRGDRLLDVVARHADGWNTAWTLTPAAYRERAAALDRACERAGRDPAGVSRSVGLLALVGEDEADLRRRFERLAAGAPPGVPAGGTTLEEWRRGHLVGPVDQVREQLARWESLGVSTIVLGLGALPFSVTHPDDLDLAASALI